MSRFGAVFFGSCLVLLTAAAGAQTPIEEGYPAGALGVEAIQRGDWAQAEQQLKADAAPRDDAARLINLGEVYYRTGRMADAVAAWEQAAAAEPFLVNTRDGRIVSTDKLARQALARLKLAAR